MEYHIEALSNKNIKDIKQLYKSVFKNKVSHNFISKKFDTSYLIKNYFGHLAYFKGSPVAFHGAIPVKMQYRNKQEIAAQYGDAMTLSQHTGKGLFTKLGERTDLLLKKSGITFVWGFPNQNSEYGCLNKLNWKYVERMQGFKISISKIPLEKMIRKTGFVNTFYTQHIGKAFSEYKVNKPLKGSVFNNEDCVSIARDQAYYQYKSFTNSFVIKIEETLFWIKIKNGLLIGDIETSSKKQFIKALSILKKIAFKCGITEIIFQTSPNTLIENLVSDIATESFESWVVGYKNFCSEFPLEKLKFTFADLDTF